LRPKIQTLGSEFSGIVEEIKQAVKTFRLGDKVLRFNFFERPCCANSELCDSKDVDGQLKKLLNFFDNNSLKYS
jgi:NADPH:quinone reductase-like Zn-dependent oxidoreductase